MNLRKIKPAVVDFLIEEEGPTAVEYAVMLGAILAVVIAAVTFLGTQNRDSLENSATAISGAVN